jgi:hypothetical protein
LQRLAPLKCKQCAAPVPISIYNGAFALQERQRKLFQTIEIIGSFLLLIIAVTAFSLVVLAIIAVLFALYLYLIFS